MHVITSQMLNLLGGRMSCKCDFETLINTVGINRNYYNYIRELPYMPSDQLNALYPIYR